MNKGPFAQKNKLRFFKSFEGSLALGLFLLLWLYLWFRAFYVPLVHDELVTYHTYMINGRWLPFAGFIDANNHLLNSFLGWISYEIFGYSGYFVPRIGNLLTFPLYFLSVFKISQILFQSKWLKFSVLAALVAPPYLLEFFALARGYGMALAFFMAAIYWFIQTIKKPSIKSDGLMVFFASLSILANLTYLFGALALFALKSLHIIKNRSIIRWSLLLLFAGLVVLGYMVWYSITLQSLGVFYYGGNQGFIALTVKSLTQEFFFTQNYMFALSLSVLVGFILLLFLFKFFKQKSIFAILNPTFVFPYLLTFCVVLILLSHLIMGVNFPEDRAALYLYPFAIVSVFLSFNYLSNGFQKIFSMLFAMFFIGSLGFSLNLTHSFHWRKDFIHPEFVEIVQKESALSPQLPTLSGFALQKTVWSQQVQAQNLNLPLLQSYQGNNPDTVSDLQLASLSRFPELKKHYHELKYNETSALSLLKRKNILRRKAIGSKKTIDVGTTTEEFIPLKVEIFDSLIGKNVLFYVQLKLSNYTFPSDLLLVIENRTSKGDLVYYEKMDLDFLLTQNNEIQLNAFIQNISSNQAGIYLWNTEKQTLKFEKLNIQFFELYP